jgi:NADH-quinone oxidoreductase subunit N
LSLAGIPFVIGFWAKLYVFMATYQAGLGWMVAVDAVLAVVGLFYYLQVARAAYMAKPTRSEPVQVEPWLAVTIVVCLLLVVGMGVYPAPILKACQSAADALISAR